MHLGQSEQALAAMKRAENVFSEEIFVDYHDYAGPSSTAIIAAKIYITQNKPHTAGLSLAIDWDRRYRLMRMHTSMHLLGSLIPVPVTGGKVGAEKSRLDFNLGDHQLDKEELTEQMNALIQAGYDIGLEAITEAELDDNPGLVRTMSVQPPRGVGDIRMVRVKDVDFQPCGGTHVGNTREIGRVRISKIENKGRQNRRVQLVLES